MNKNKIKQKQVTINDLAIITKDGFDRMDKKFNQHDKIFEVMIKELKTIHEDNKYFRENISSLNSDGLSYNRKIDNLTARVEKLESKVQ
jgi:septal ring factor EnvC (AmiA/AmiB activator)